MPAAPDVGLRCDPATIYGRLPARYDLLRTSGRGAVTDVMSVPPTVALRAYQAAARGKASTFFYVRRFEPVNGGPDEYVAVTCRLAGGGARTPFALTDVTLAFAADVPVLAVAPGEPVAPIVARITYNGTGRLEGRWELVRPGEEPPTAEDLLSEAALPVERRGTQRRYTELERFNVFLPPGGKAELRGPPVDRLSTKVDGMYLVLLRIEADDEREGDSDLGAAGAGSGVVHSGAVAGFPLPPLRYVVGSLAAVPALGRSGASDNALGLLLPRDSAAVPADSAIVLRWRDQFDVDMYRVDVATARGDETVFTGYVRPGFARYALPPFVRAAAAGRDLRWRVVALDAAGRVRQSSVWRVIKF